MATMKAAVLRGFGGPDMLKMEEVERPTLGEGEVLVKFAGTSVNPIDYKVRNGQLRFMIGEDKLPLVLGRDVAGTIEEVGPGVADWRPGEAVFARPGLDRGTFSDYALVRLGEMAAAPRSIPLAEAGVVPLAALVAWQGLVDAGGLQAGQRVLVHGGAGGVGHLAVQIARALGATVFATCSAGDVAFVRGLGAERAIDYRAERFEEIATGIDLVLDNIGSETERRSWGVLKPGGILVSPVQKPDAEAARQAGARPSEQLLAKASPADLAHVASMIDAGEVAVTISGRYPLGRVGDALAALEHGGVRGKLLITEP